MQNETHQCYNCRWYNAVYTKVLSTFERKNVGFCSKCKNVVEKHEGCDKWEFNTPTNRYSNRYSKRYLRKDIAYKKLIESLEDLKVLEQIFREEYEENKTDPLPPDK